MKTTICDVCKRPIEGHKYRIITVSFPEEIKESYGAPHSLDFCLDCYESPVIFNEMRRTRTRKPKAKVGRPKKAKVTSSTFVMPEGALVTTTLTDAQIQADQQDGRR